MRKVTERASGQVFWHAAASKALILLALAFVGEGVARADAADSFRAGRFAEAIREGRAEATAPSLILAGRSTLNIAGFDTRDKARAKALLAEAERDFDAAIVKAANNQEARVQKAISVGYRAKLTQSPGDAKLARKLMEAALAMGRRDALANAALGGWHGGGVATLGRFMASTVLGANLKDMERHFAVALADEPDQVIHPVTFGFVLLDVDAGNARRAAALLRAAAKLPARDAFDRLNQRAAAAVLAKIDAGDAKGARTLSRKLQPFGDVG